MTTTIEWDSQARQFHLRNSRISYVMAVLEDGSLGQLYLGPALALGRSYRHLLPGQFRGFSNRLGDPIRLEYPSAGSGDFRVPAVEVVHLDGSTVLELRYAEHNVRAGKPPIPGLPSTYVEADDEAESLEVILVDAPSGLEVGLRYTIFADHPVISRSVRFRNGGRDAVRLTCALSASLDLGDVDWDLLQLSGTWAGERQVFKRHLAPGRQSISSRRGASSHQHNPFIALLRPATTEELGEAIGLS